MCGPVFLCVQFGRLLLQPGDSLCQPLLAERKDRGADDLAEFAGQGTAPQLDGEHALLRALRSLGPDEKAGAALTLSLIHIYRMDSVGVSGSNIDATKEKVGRMLDTVCQAFDKQLDALFGEEALDISTDITVMENLLAQEGFGSMNINQTAKNQDGGITLEL